MSAQIHTLEPPESIDFTNKKDPLEGQFSNGGNDEAVLDYWRFTTFTLRYCFSYEKQHSVKLFTGT